MDRAVAVEYCYNAYWEASMRMEAGLYWTASNRNITKDGVDSRSMYHPSYDREH